MTRLGSLERTATWDDPADYARCVARSYRRDFWIQQPHRIRSLVRRKAPCAACLPRCSIRSRRRLSSSARISAAPLRLYDIAEDDDGRDLIVLYVGDYDPSGMFMSEEDLPARFTKYDGDHVKLRRIALTAEHTAGTTVIPGGR